MGPELAVVLATRSGAPPSLIGALADGRDRWFDRAVAHHVWVGHWAVFAAYHAALATITAARRVDVPVLLDYPVAHHAYAQRVFGEELLRVPDYADTMQFHNTAARRRERLDAELEAADFVLALSSFHRRTFIEQGIPAERVVVNPLGVDTTRFVPRGPSRTGPGS